jgi:hypothetical protein
MKSHTDYEPVAVSKIVSRTKVSGSYRRVTLVTSEKGHGFYAVIYESG